MTKKKNKKQKIEEVVRMPIMVRKITTLSDGGIKISIHTSQEVSDEDIATVFGMKNKEGWMAFKPEKPEVEDMQNLPEMPKEFEGQKSSSERLRNVLYRYWEQRTNQNKDFDVFYKAMMNKIIVKYKERLD